MTTKYTISEITADTLKSSNVLQLVWRAFEEFEAYQHTAEGIREFKNYFEYSSIKRMMDNSELMMWGCFHNETCTLHEVQSKIIGMIASKQTNHVSMLFVDKEYHRQGIARTLYQKLVEHCSKIDGCSEITVNSSMYAVEAYKRMGFVATDAEQQKNGIRYVPMKHKFR